MVCVLHKLCTNASYRLENLNSKSTITYITHNTDYLYASTMGGSIVQINKRTGEQHCIDHAQDGFPDNYVLSVTLHNNEL